MSSENQASGQFKIKDISKGNRPKWQQYAAVTLGTTAMGTLIKFELINLLCCNMPGALGILLRSKLYPTLLQSVGKNVVFGCGVTLRHPQKITIGNNVIVDDNCVLDAKGETNRGITIGNDVFIGRNSILYCKNGDMEIQDKVNIGANCEVYSKQRLVDGKGTLIAAYNYIMSGGRYDYRSAIPLAEQSSYSDGPTIVGENCWLGAKGVVLDGVSIGHNAIVGAGAVVTKDIPDAAIAMGIPAKVVGQRKIASEEATSKAVAL
ncbi:MAG: DapH/DapD/GlmU-related protein [Phormidesmis sp.]